MQSATSMQTAGSLPSTVGFSFIISTMWAQKRHLQKNPKACTYKCCAVRQQGWFWKFVLVPDFPSFHSERSQAADLCHASFNCSRTTFQTWYLGWKHMSCFRRVFTSKLKIMLQPWIGKRSYFWPPWLGVGGERGGSARGWGFITNLLQTPTYLQWKQRFSLASWYAAPEPNSPVWLLLPPPTQQSQAPSL